MAALGRGLSGFARKLVALGGPGIRITTKATRMAGVALAGAGAVYTGIMLVKRSGYQSPGIVMRVCAQSEVTVDETQEKQSLRKQRFMHFASLEYEGEYYMTPRDFLFSVMFENLQHKTSARNLTKKEFDSMLSVAAKAKPGPKFFRDLGDNGLISYTEYLFLLTILTKPKTGFQIAFEMLDADDNDQVDKKEFFKLQKILGTKDEIKMNLTQETSSDSDIKTTLLVHFFGRGGQDKLQYSRFYRFIENLQTEVQEMEFAQFSKGLDFMRKEDFAEWLLFFTDEEDNDIYWHNVKTRIPPGESISLEEFKRFYHFMNNLEDFSITMKMFSMANKAVKLAEFKRAVKVATGEELSENVLDTVFKIFDLDGDNCLSHGEFLGVLKNRLHRGLKHVPQQQGLQGYWKCVKRETIKGANEVWKQVGKSPF
ncbi:calcium uptake protein 2, mitochondrial [Hyla sarda]|uniref:calcium uptake protein 2, mitochondrial n=1 Tax=Hyla sarda TaxID=327740 RepID=UPI0024C27C8E|nr:calcium uptake protein 2, mitochondrial [Hyla sarda]